MEVGPSCLRKARNCTELCAISAALFIIYSVCSGLNPCPGLLASCKYLFYFSHQNFKHKILCALKIPQNLFQPTKKPELEQLTLITSSTCNVFRKKLDYLTVVANKRMQVIGLHKYQQSMICCQLLFMTRHLVLKFYFDFKK